MRQNRAKLLSMTLAAIIASLITIFSGNIVKAANKTIQQSGSYASLYVRKSGYKDFMLINGNSYAANSRDEAKAQARAMCDVGQRIGFGTWVSDISWEDQNTGRFSYTIHMFAKSCGAGRTRLFAITGYPWRGFAVCPVAGYWRFMGGSRWDPNNYWEVYDCMKFQNEWDLYGRTVYGTTGYGAVNWSKWNSIKKGGSWAQPPTNGVETQATFSGQIPGDAWSSDGGEFVFLNGASIGSYYWETNGYGTFQHVKCAYCNESLSQGHINYNDSDDISLYASIKWKTDLDPPKPGPKPSDGAESEVRTNKHGWATYIGTARPGQNAQWRHRVNVDCKGTVDNNRFSSGVNKSRDWSGGRSFAIRCGDNTNYSPQKVLVASDTKKTYCENAWYKYRYTYAYVYLNDNGYPVVRKEDLGVRNETNGACVYIPYHVPGCQGDDCSPSEECREGDGSSCSNTNLTQSGVVGSADIISGGKSISGGTVSYDQDIDFKYTFNNRYGPSRSPDVTYTAHIFTLEGEYNPSTKYTGFNHDPDPSELVPGHAKGYFVNESFPGTTGELDPRASTSKNHGGRRVSNILGQPGDQICTYVVMGTNASMVNDKPSDTYMASPMKCVRIAKRPQLQINGSDSYAGQGFEGTGYNSDALRGSYTQYSQLTNGGASSLFGSAGYTHLSGNNWYRMIYANTDKVGGKASDKLFGGGLDQAYLAKDAISRLDDARKFAMNGLGVSKITSNNLDINSLDGSKFNNIIVSPSGGTLNVSGAGSAKAGAIMVNGNVTITGNIGDMNNYNDNGTLTIYATGNISVNAGVGLIHANLVAGGKVLTCAEGGGGKSQKNAALGNNGACSGKLKVNGAVISKVSPSFQRTFGAGTCDVGRQGRTCQTDYKGEAQYNNWWIGATSEWLNYTPDSWYLANKVIDGNGLKAYQTTTVLSRPARY